ncbi:hypothetical protein SteCoe_18278 [Stentor coeruleus]|uniref:Protein kinase domain-containing protein n=1 Tax=Stentor coeruleus TaxID=5963 RepID=A0A1R2BX17_9CILI|nr:hypothetical protein SteCoe_18278 [Stentor coeruleus]
MPLEDLEISKELIYKNTNVEIRLAYYRNLNITVCVKIIEARNIEDAETKKLEAENLTIASGFPAVIKFYECFIHLVNSHYFTYIVTEYCNRKTLYDDISIRIACKIPYCEESIYETFFSLITCFKSLQEKNLCHRDIKPGNIFISSNGEMKIGDFGEAKISIDESKHTIKGTPSFLSPKLRLAISELNRSDPDCHRTFHNPYKSDVYSLGLVYLSMINLIKIDKEFSDMNLIQENISYQLSKIHNEPLRNTLKKMLEHEEDNRPDFIELANILHENRISPAYYRNDKKKRTIICLKCELIYPDEEGVVIKPLCVKCRHDLRCESCDNFIRKKLKCRHQTCEIDRKFKTNCYYCYKTLTCHYCMELTEYNKASKTHFCFKCNLEFCCICKNKRHDGVICNEANWSDSIIGCCLEKCIKIPKSLFSVCQICQCRWCIACYNKEDDIDHRHCQNSLQNFPFIKKENHQIYARITEIREEYIFSAISCGGQNIIFNMQQHLLQLIDIKINDIVVIENNENNEYKFVRKYSVEESNSLRRYGELNNI